MERGGTHNYQQLTPHTRKKAMRQIELGDRQNSTASTEGTGGREREVDHNSWEGSHRTQPTHSYVGV